MGGISGDCTNVNVDTPWGVPQRIAKIPTEKSQKYT
jgi:hypothetical protein